MRILEIKQIFNLNFLLLIFLLTFYVVVDIYKLNKIILLLTSIQGGAGNYRISLTIFLNYNLGCI